MLSEGREVAMLVNGLGSTPLMELYVVADAALKHAQDKLKVGCLTAMQPLQHQLSVDAALPNLVSTNTSSTSTKVLSTIELAAEYKQADACQVE